MNRRWQKEATDTYRTLESFDTFLDKLTPLPSCSLGISDASDVYATLSVLHSKGRNPQLHANQDPGFYYFLTDAERPAGGGGGDQAEGGVGGGALTAVRLEAVVPVGSKSRALTSDVLELLFRLEAHPNTTHILLAIVDDDGSVSLMRMFNYVQPPFEGPETLPPLQTGPGGEESDED